MRRFGPGDLLCLPRGLRRSGSGAGSQPGSFLEGRTGATGAILPHRRQRRTGRHPDRQWRRPVALQLVRIRGGGRQGGGGSGPDLGALFGGTAGDRHLAPGKQGPVVVAGVAAGRLFHRPGPDGGRLPRRLRGRIHRGAAGFVPLQSRGSRGRAGESVPNQVRAGARETTRKHAAGGRRAVETHDAQELGRRPHRNVETEDSGSSGQQRKRGGIGRQHIPAMETHCLRAVGVRASRVWRGR
mmetsp:Transcript_10113/g.21417  ORF Transcript_10113/g.21417 Transcript_10113/m.21417 type:complete len:241 (+) Transcript_10113:783-1505(+)